jgi:transposase InsO family protein
VIGFLKSTGLKPKRTSVQAPWQNGIAERWIGSCRRELLDHVIALGESHLRGLIRDYVNYHHEDRIRDSLQKDTPNQRAAENKLCFSRRRRADSDADRGAKRENCFLRKS